MERKIHRETSDALLAEINEHRLTEEAFRASGHRLRDILDYSTAVVSVKDLDLRYIFANREYERQFHVRRDQIHGKTDYEIHSRAVADTVRLNDLRVIETGTPIQFEAGVPMAEGERLYIFVKFLLRDHAETPYAVCGIATDITASKRAEEIQVERARQAALRADIHAAFSVTQSTLPAMLQRSAQAIVDHLDAAFARIWTLNDLQNTLELQASAGLYTRLDGEHARVAVGKLKIGLIAQERRPHLTNDVLNDKRISHPEWAKREGIVAFAGYPLLVEGRLVGVLAMFSRKLLGHNTLETLEGVADTIAQNIERKRAEEKLARLNRTLQTLYQCNQALVRATEEYELLQSVCRILVDAGGLRVAWVGYRELDEEKTVRPVAQAGFEDGYLERINITWADTERGRGPTGTAIRSGASCWNRDILTDPNMAAWRAEALRRGYASSIALPLMYRGEAFGALSLYAEDPAVFNENTIKQYTDLANNLAYGIMALRTLAERARAENALRESEQRLQDVVDNTTAVVFVKDLELRYMLVNREYERRHGVQRDQIRGKTDFDIFPHDVAEAVRANDRQVIESGVPIEFEEAVPSGEGERWYISAKFLLRDHTGKPYAVCGIATDITERKRAESEIHQLNASLEKQASKLSKTNTALKQSLQALAQDPDLNSFLGHLLIEMAHQFGTTSSALYVIEHPERRLMPHLVYENGRLIPGIDSGHPVIKNPRVYALDDPVWLAFCRNQPMIRQNPQSDTTLGFTQAQRAYYAEKGITGLLNVPFLFGAEVVGSLQIQFRDQRIIDQEAVELAQTFAPLATLALQLTKIAEQSKQIAIAQEQALFAGQKAEELGKANEALRGCLDALASVPELDEFLGQVMGAITRQLGAVSSVLRLHDFERNILSLDLVFQDGRVMTPAEAKYPVNLQTLPLDERQLSILKQPAAVLRHLDPSTRFPEPFRSYILGLGVKTSLVIPLSLASQLVGSITFRFTEDREFRPDELE